jgi:SOS response regulatory protein OraA/RecX
MADRDVMEAALGALRYRDLSAHELEQKLAGRGFGESEREEAVGTLKRTGLLDDERFAEGRAASLAARGAGDALIRDALERAGVPDQLVIRTVESLEPESERARAIAERRGLGPKTARYLNAKGFSRETIHELVASQSREEIG